MLTPSRITVPALAAALMLLGTACAHKEVLPPAETPVTTTSAQPNASPTSGRDYESNELSVSGDIVRACNIRFGDVDQAPKFDFDRSSLQPQDRDVLQQVATCLTTGPLAGRSIELIGRTDPRGTVEYNFALGEHRASTVETYLTQLGVDKAKTVETSRGELDATGKNEATWQRDRRVDIVLR